MMQSQEIHRDIEKTLGHVPEFMKAVPDESLEGFWSLFKNFQMAETAIPAKYKELIGLGVASQIPCAYCVTFHKEAAQLNGASEREIKEAIAMAAVTRFGSTVLNGLQQDMDEFHAELREMVSHLKSAAPAAGRGAPTPSRR